MADIENLSELTAWIGPWLMPKYMPADFLKELNELGLRIVPGELGYGYAANTETKEAMARAYHEKGDIWDNVYRAAIAASPFSPEQEGQS